MKISGKVKHRTFSSSEIWQHNGFRGCVMGMDKNLQRIIEADTPTEHSKALARRIRMQLYELQNSLEIRTDQEKKKTPKGSKVVDDPLGPKFTLGHLRKALAYKEARSLKEIYEALKMHVPGLKYKRLEKSLPWLIEKGILVELEKDYYYFDSDASIDSILRDLL